MKSINYKKTVTESTLLFLGIFLALLLENYVADQELDEKQNRLLGELVIDLDETIADIQNDIESHSGFFDRTKEIIEVLNQNDSERQRNLRDNELTLGGIQEICVNYAFVVPKTSTYESIKSLGLDLIEDDTLRTQVSGFYELTLFRISTAEQRIYDFTDRECWTYVAKNFTWASPLELTNRDIRLGPNAYVTDWMALGELRALDYQELMSDPVFKSMIRELAIRRSTQLLHYRIGLAEATRVRSALDQYLG
jgi:hypothetical protein